MTCEQDACALPIDEKLEMAARKLEQHATNETYAKAMKLAAKIVRSFKQGAKVN